ncbi:hypothetical protein [Halobacteriovorax sp. YZS-1-1]|uniref:hypothetical protein n=1 Tax=unclassified Halobacteriovorax TaxID=2639665 RepID=UPI00399AC3AF
MRLMAYTANENKLYLADKIEEKSGLKIEYIKKFPKYNGVGELLILDLDDESIEFKDKLIDEIQYIDANFVYLVGDFFGDRNKRIIHMGGELFTFKSLNDTDFIEVLFNRLVTLEIYKLFSIIGRTDMDLFRAINRAGNGEREIISKSLFGSSSENTIDVNLSRLRKKLRDPEIGNDFFRIITKSRRFYLVNQLNGYEIPEELLI